MEGGEWSEKRAAASSQVTVLGPNLTTELAVKKQQTDGRLLRCSLSSQQHISLTQQNNNNDEINRETEFPPL